MNCGAKIDSIIRQNNCLIQRTPIFNFSINNGQSHFELMNLDTNSQIEHYYNNDSSYYNSTRQGEQYQEIYIVQLALNISLYSDKNSPILNTYYISCDFQSGEINTNSSCGNYDVLSEDEWPVCCNNSTIVNVGISVSNPTVDNVQCEINQGFIHYCTVIAFESANTVTTTLISYGTVSNTTSDSLNPTYTVMTTCYHIPFKNTSLSELCISSSAKVHASSKELQSTIGLTVGMSASILVLAVLLTMIILIVILWIYARRKAVRQKQYSEQHAGSHSLQDQSELPTSANVYEQVHLHPSTQITPSAESETISNTAWQPQSDFDGIYSHFDTERPKLETQGAEVNTCDDPTYDTVGNENNKEKSKISHDSAPVSSKNEDLIAHNDKASYLVETLIEPKLSKEALEVMYAVVNKKRKKDEDAPPVPSHTVEELYTAVAKNSKVKAKGDEEKPIQDQLPLPTIMIKEQYTAVQKDSKDMVENKEVAQPPPPHTVEELYTAVQKTIKGTSVDCEDEAPPIPPHTVEELYTAVMKKPKGNTEDKEEAPPIPPYTVDNTSCSLGIND